MFPREAALERGCHGGEPQQPRVGLSSAHREAEGKTRCQSLPRWDFQGGKCSATTTSTRVGADHSPDRAN